MKKNPYQKAIDLFNLHLYFTDKARDEQSDRRSSILYATAKRMKSLALLELEKLS